MAQLTHESGSSIRSTASGDADDRAEIRELLENWVLWRDSGDWERFATVWHADGRMHATWFEAAPAEFVERCRRGFEAGMTGLHSLGGTAIDLAGDRAVAQTRMTIVQRAPVHGVLVDVTCYGRFVDAIERRGGVWRILVRQPVYELDRIDAVDPTATLSLDPAVLDSFPQGYRHLAYLQTEMGFTIPVNLPGTRGDGVAALMRRMSTWLATGAGL